MSDGSVRLDFGVSQNMDGDEYGSVSGTNAYQGPEVFQLKRMDFGSDIFAVGLIVFQMLTGRHSYEGGSEIDTIDKIKKGSNEKIPDWISREMKELIESMLDPISSKRPSTKKIMEQETIRVFLKMQKEREKEKEEIIRLKDELAKELDKSDIPKKNTKVLHSSMHAISSIDSIPPVAIFEHPDRAHQEGNKIVKTDDDDGNAL
ncbi:MAG: hypothetical protein EZS28_003871, partial [Streblomastix strix]